MKPIALDPGNYTGTYKLVGEEISFDFINTISWPDSEWRHDWLNVPKNFILWAVAAGVINKRQAKTLAARSKTELEKELRHVLTIRSDLAKVLTPLAFNKKPAEGAINKLDKLIHQVNDHHSLDPRRYNWVWDEPHSFNEVLAPVIWNAGQVLTESDHSRIRHCPSCNWIFFDTTKNRSRRWCDMDDCGSRDKALRYYHRQK